MADPVVEPISVSLFKSTVLLLLPESCYDEYFVNYNFLDAACMKTSISKGLGLGIIAGSLTVKFPQIFKLWNSKSAKGVSLVSVLADLFAVTAVTSYSYVKAFPFSTWGEGLFLAVQTLIINSLVLHYNVSGIVSSVFSAAYSVLFYILVSGFTPVDVLWSMQSVSVPVMFLGKLVQAWANYKNKSTGQLSAATCGLLLAGSLARIFTSIQETGDSLIIITYLLATVGNAIIVAQMIYYSHRSKKQAEKVNKAKKKH